jgi:23S rRNA pseudouridine1911/1915/1917 synthase
MNSSERPGLVHRIDKDTRIIMIAKPRQRWHIWRNNLKLNIRKRVCSFVSNVVEEQERLKVISKSRKDRMQMAVLLTWNRKASSYRNISLGTFCYVTDFLPTETGRTHKIACT